MVSCSVPNCGNKGSKSKYKIEGVSYHKFPRDPRRKRLWVSAIKKDDSWIPTKFSLICSEHFDEKYFYMSAKGRRLLNTKAIPSLFLPQESTADKFTQADFDWFLIDKQLLNETPITSTSEFISYSKPSTSLFNFVEIVEPQTVPSFTLTNFRHDIDEDLSPDEDLKIQSDDTPYERKLKYALRSYTILYKRNRQKVKKLTQAKSRNRTKIQNLKNALSTLKKDN